MQNEPQTSEDISADIAVIGMAGRFPCASNIDEFWDNIRSGKDCISRYTDDELEQFGVPTEKTHHPDFVKAGAMLDHIDMFDASFFGFSPREAEIIDPQQRIFLECAWEAIEYAGYNVESYDGPIGVYAGINPNHYVKRIPDASPDDPAGEFQQLIGNDKDFLSTRVSHKFDLKGPSLTVQTACSSSLVAVHLAVQSLLNYQCSMALAGGVSINLDHRYGYVYQEGMILSPDGFCRAFDAAAQGTVLSQGVGIVVLKRLADALSDGDTIHAIIKGIATNNDGAVKVAYTAPSVEGQAEVVFIAQELGGVKADTIGYVEAHGTATPLGDPVEVAALTQAFRANMEQVDKTGFCALGSVKTNIGHADAAAGIAGFIKTVQALRHKEIPPSIHFEKPNPEIDFDASPFFVNKHLQPWKMDGMPRRAGISSFGIGGTNAHAVVEEAPRTPSSDDTRPHQLLVLSAKNDAALDRATANLKNHLDQHHEMQLADVAFTLQAGRKRFDRRRIVICEGRDDAMASLDALPKDHTAERIETATEREVVFMFPGQGSQYVNMGLGTYRTERIFREQIDRCCEALEPHLGVDLREILYPPEERADEATERLKHTAITQPALFVIEYALARLWMSWGVQPVAMVGHSIGEYVAATLSGVFHLENALALVAIRGKLLGDLPGGSMIAIPLSEEELLPFLNDNLAIAAVNSPSLCVASGDHEAVRGLEKSLVSQGVDPHFLHTSHAFHSQMVEPILDEFRAKVARIDLALPDIPILSTVTGTWAADEMTRPDYWADNLRQSVRFSECAQQLVQGSDRILLEVGPGQTLSSLTKRQTDFDERQVVIASMRHPNERKPDTQVLMRSLGQLWLAGAQIDWANFYCDEHRRRVPLPTYPFQRQRFWIAEDNSNANMAGSRHTSLPMSRNKLHDWFYVPSWKRSIVGPPDQSNASGMWLIFSDDCGIGERLVDRLAAKGIEVTVVRKGVRYSRQGERSFEVNPAKDSDYDLLFGELREIGALPTKLIHLWSLTADAEREASLERLETLQNLGLYSMLAIARGLDELELANEIQLEIVTQGVHEVVGNETLIPENATILGPAKVIPLEYANTRCRCIDLQLAQNHDSSEATNLVDRLLAEFETPPTDPVVTYRGNHRWTPDVQRMPMDHRFEHAKRLREQGVYLITGGLGGIGLALAEYLAGAVQAKLILVSRSEFPNKNSWTQWLSSHDETDETSQKIRKIQAIEALGGEVHVVRADVSDMAQMESTIAFCEETAGQIHGVIHSAGVVDRAGTIQRRAPEATEETIQSKTRGTIVLDLLFAERRLDFVLLCSSVASDLFHNRFAQVGYVAANSFLDAYAFYMSRTDGRRVITLNWDDWREVGMSVKAAEQFSKKYGIEGFQFDPLDSFTPAEGVAVFRRVLNSDFPRVIISTRDLSKRIALDEHAISPFLEAAAKADQSRTTHPRPDMDTPFVAPTSTTERAIAEVWQELLGVAQVGIHDDFFTLGGDSLRATQIVAKLKRSLQLDLPSRSLFGATTIAELADKIDNLTWAVQGEQHANSDAVGSVVEGDL